jgi:hypothetical protein
MNKLNLPPFYIGQKVVYLTGINMPKGTICKVSDYHVNPCGCKYLYVNNEKKEYEFGATDAPFFKCNTCGDIYLKSSGPTSTNGWVAESFAPIEEAPLLTFSQIKKAEKEEILILN